MRIAAVIPSRFQSSRFPGKPLVMIAGQSMIERVYRQADKAKCFDDIIVATDDPRISAEVTRFGGKAEMTDNNIKSGSERVWSVIKSKDFDAVINIQGDEPLIPEQLIRKVFQVLAGGEPIVSAVYRSDSYEDFRSRDVVKVVCDRKDQALYFSRSPIPYSTRNSFKDFLQHVGIYGYTTEMLEAFIHGEVSDLERKENLEQLRFLFLGRPIRMIRTDFISRGVDVPGDIEKIEALLRG